MKKGWRITWTALLVLYLLAVCYICFSPGDAVPKLPLSLFGIPIDKAVHFCMFLPFVPLVFMGVCSALDKPVHLSRKTVLLVAACMLLALACAYGTEVIQKFLPTRDYDIKDFMADCLAILLSTCGFLLCLRR